MNKFTIILVVSLLIATITTFLLYSAGVASKVLTLTYGATFSLSMLIFYITIEYIILRDATFLKDIITNYLRTGKFTENAPGFSLQITKDIYRNLNLLQKRHQKEVKRLNERAEFRTQFIADVSHELKTPIFAAQGYVHTLLDGAMEDEEVRLKFLKKSANSLDLLDKLVKDLLELSQIETGNIVLMKGHFDIVKLVDEVLDDFEHTAGKQKVKLSRKRTPKEAIVYADYLRIRQVLQNLISNAIKYNVENGKVNVTVIDQPQAVEIKVADTGIGIPEEDLPKVFTRFYKVDKSRTKVKKRTSNGLGLSIVKHLLESHSSNIILKSEIGKGSEFSFTLQKDKANEPIPKIDELDII